MPEPGAADAWPELYRAHFEEWTRRFADACRACSVNGVLVLSGSIKRRHRDDIEIPFVAEPYFRVWVPQACPDAALRIVPGEAPRLAYVRNDDFWTVPAPVPEGVWTDEFDTRQTEARERESIRAIPDGRYEAEGWRDDDGLGSDPVPVNVTVSVWDDAMTIDLSGSGAQTRGPLNCGITQTVAAARVAFKLLVCSDDPANGGSFRSLDVSAPTGSIFHATEPAPCDWYFTPPGLLIDLVVKALAPAMPDKPAGARYGDSMVVTFAGLDPRHDDIRYLMAAPTTGGWRGYEGGNGADSLINNVNGSFKDLPVEIFQSKYPIRIDACGTRPDSGGTGAYRGGNGTYRRYVLDAESQLSPWFERSKSTGWGLFGGGDGIAPDAVIEAPGRDPRHYLKVNSMSLPKGTVVTTYTGADGGYRPALERNPEDVRQDELDGFVSSEHARDAYGVVLTRSLQIDLRRTDRQRRSMGNAS